MFYVLQNLESQEKRHMMHKDTLSREHRYLRRRLEQLTTTVNVNKRRSVSESSSYTTASGASTTSSACSTSSSPSISESGTINKTINLHISPIPLKPIATIMMLRFRVVCTYTGRIDFRLNNHQSSLAHVVIKSFSTRIIWVAN